MLCCVAAYKGLYHNTGDCLQKALQKYSSPWIIILYIIMWSKNFVPLFKKIAQTEECEIWHSYSLYGEGVQNANIILIMPKIH